LGLGEFDKRDPEFELEYPAQMAIADVQAGSERTQSRIGEQSVFDQTCSGISEPARGVHTRIARRKLWPATQARPITRSLGRCCISKDRAMLTLGALTAQTGRQ
jgi:hypothetical protein